MSKLEYSSRRFLLGSGTDANGSLSAISCRLEDLFGHQGEAHIRISDGNSNVYLVNNVFEKEGMDEMLEKITSIEKELSLFKEHLLNMDKKQIV